MIDTQLADRTAQTANAGKNVVASGTAGLQSSGAHSPALDPRKHPSTPPEPSPQEILAVTRTELSEAQRSRSELQDRLTRTNIELEKLRKKGTQDTRRIGALENEVTRLQMRLKDRDEELKAKAKLLEVWCSCLLSLLSLHITDLPYLPRTSRMNWHRSLSS